MEKQQLLLSRYFCSQEAWKVKKKQNKSASKRDSYTHFRGIKLDARMYDIFEGIFFSGVFGVINDHCRRG